MKQLLLVLVCAISSLNAMELVIKKNEGLFVPEELGSLEVMHTSNGFLVQKAGEVKEVNAFDVDPLLKKIDRTQLEALIKTQAGYIAVSKLGNDYKLQAKIRGDGGGAFGAWLGSVVGKVGVSALGHTTLYYLAAATGPAAPATLYALEAAFGPAIETASTAAGIGLGIALGVATGPA